MPLSPPCNTSEAIPHMASAKLIWPSSERLPVTFAPSLESYITEDLASCLQEGTCPLASSGSLKINAKLYCAPASPCSAAFLNHLTASL